MKKIKSILAFVLTTILCVQICIIAYSINSNAETAESSEDNQISVNNNITASKTEIKVGEEVDITVTTSLTGFSISHGKFVVYDVFRQSTEDSPELSANVTIPISGVSKINPWIDGKPVYFDEGSSSNHISRFRFKATRTGCLCFAVYDTVLFYYDNSGNEKSVSENGGGKSITIKVISDGSTQKDDSNTSSSGTEAWYKVKTSGDPLNIRSGPGTDYGVVTQIPNGADVQFVESSGDWTKVTYNGKTGYVSSKYITVDYDTEEPTETETQEATAEETVEIKLGDKTFAVVNDSESIKAPDGFIKTTANVDGKDIIAFQNDDFSKYGKYLVYVLEEDGKTTAYVYDSKSGSIEKYKSSEKAEETEKTTEEISNTEPNTKEDNIVISKKTVIIIGAVSAAFLAALAAIIVLSVKLKKQKLGGAEKTDKPEGLISDGELNENDDSDGKEESVETSDSTDYEEVANTEKENKTKKKEKAKKPPKPKKQKKNKDKKPENVPIQIVLNRQPETDNTPKE